jgi:hypothetical protein
MTSSRTMRRAIAIRAIRADVTWVRPHGTCLILDVDIRWLNNFQNRTMTQAARVTIWDGAEFPGFTDCDTFRLDDKVRQQIRDAVILWRLERGA